MNSIRNLKLAAIGVGVLSGSLFFAWPRANAQTKPVETAGQKFKNLKVLNDMPADQMGKVMNMMSASLGVDCKMCHSLNDKDFEKEGNEHKDIAREMIKMTFLINKQFFDGNTEVSCSTCHNGKERPVSVPNLNPVEHATRPKQPDVNPTVDQILAKYETALGGKAKIASIKNRTVNALRIEPDGRTIEPETVTQKGAAVRVETKYGDYIVAENYDGKTVTKTGGGSPIELKPDEAEQIKREAQIFAGGDLKTIYSKLDYRFMDKLDGRDVYLVLGTLADNSRERLFFDVATGLLVRRIASTPTVIGAFQYQVDYSEYKDFGGVKLPTLTRFAVPAISWTRRVVDVKAN